MRILVIVLSLLSSVAPASALGFDTKAVAAMVVDYETGTVLMEKNADMALPPASMSKLMTLNMLFEALQEGRLRLDSKFRVSTKAWQKGGSKMFVREGESVSIENLIRGIIIQSGNDACLVVAEGLAGSEAEFANRMTKRARQLGMTNSVFANSTGWPHPDHKMSARDMITLTKRLIRDFPEYYPYFAEKTFTWADIEQSNRNPLLQMDIGADGLKTGHTEESGYGLVGSGVQDGRRVVFVVMGLASTAERAQESERLLSWAFREFTPEVLFDREQVVAVADVWLGASDVVGLVPGSDLTALIPFSGRQDVKATVVYDGPIEAPIQAGQEIARLMVSIPGLSDQSYPLVAADAVERGGFLKRMAASAQLLSQKVIETAASNAQ